MLSIAAQKTRPLVGTTIRTTYISSLNLNSVCMKLNILLLKGPREIGDDDEDFDTKGL